MATTTNFGWETPDDTDLVKDGALAMRTLGNAIDASLVDLKGGTTGQVLSKNSNTDMDFTWVTSDDANAIQNAIVDAKGDLIAASAADTPARLAVGNNGDTLVADSSTTTGLRWQGNFAAGKNKIINGDFGIWQRGTSFTNPAAGSYTADRYFFNYSGTFTGSISQQTFTPGTAPVSGYEGKFFLRINRTNSTSIAPTFYQRIEDVQTLAGQTVTFSFWAKADTNRTLGMNYFQNFGSGGSGAVIASAGSASLTTSWQRFTTTFTMPSIAGKTIGTSSFVTVYFDLPDSATFTIDFWGMQLEAGNTATAFQTATGTLAGELAACQRYYTRETVANTYTYLRSNGNATSTTLARIIVPLPVPMRTKPSSLDYGGALAVSDGVTLYGSGTFLLSGQCTPQNAQIEYTHGSAVFTQYRYYSLQDNNNGATYVGFSAEL